MSIIEVNNLTKEYKLGAMSGLKDTALNAFNRLRGKPIIERERFKALDDVSFKIEEGEVVGIIGTNGAGKSTLLKHLAHITTPTSGEIIVQGSVAPLIEVGAGLNPELTGRENIFLNGAILGIPKNIIRQKMDEIIEFAELEQFIDTPIKRYSSGMSIRIGFSIATSLDAGILIVDEVLSVGDLAFQRKCFDRMEDMIKRQGKTVLLVSHNIRQVERLCSRVILLDHGRILGDGKPAEICNTFINRTNLSIKKNKENSGILEAQNSGDLTDLQVEFINHQGEVSDMLEFMEPATIRFHFKAKNRISQVAVYVGIHTTDFVYLTNNNTAYDVRDFNPGEHTIDLCIEKLPLVPGVFSTLLWIGTPEGKVTYHAENLASFRVVSDHFWISRQQNQAIFHMPAEWKFY